MPIHRTLLMLATAIVLAPVTIEVLPAPSVELSVARRLHWWSESCIFILPRMRGWSYYTYNTRLSLRTIDNSPGGAAVVLT